MLPNVNVHDLLVGKHKTNQNNETKKRKEDSKGEKKTPEVDTSKQREQKKTLRTNREARMYSKYALLQRCNLDVGLCNIIGKKKVM